MQQAYMKIQSTDPDQLDKDSLAEEEKSEQTFTEQDESESEQLNEQEIILKRARRLAKLAKQGFDEINLNDSILLDHELNKDKSLITPHDKLLKMLESQQLDHAMDYM